nr:MAG TPA: hypothetical protein [Caudoviricetes sp.]
MRGNITHKSLLLSLQLLLNIIVFFVMLRFEGRNLFRHYYKFITYYIL